MKALKRCVCIEHACPFQKEARLKLKPKLNLPILMTISITSEIIKTMQKDDRVGHTDWTSLSLGIQLQMIVFKELTICLLRTHLFTHVSLPRMISPNICYWMEPMFNPKILVKPEADNRWGGGVFEEVSGSCIVKVICDGSSVLQPISVVIMQSIGRHRWKMIQQHARILHFTWTICDDQYLSNHRGFSIPILKNR